MLYIFRATVLCIMPKHVAALKPIGQLVGNKRVCTGSLLYGTKTVHFTANLKYTKQLRYKEHHPMKINCDKFLLRKYVADSSKSCGK